MHKLIVGVVFVTSSIVAAKALEMGDYQLLALAMIIAQLAWLTFNITGRRRSENG